MLQNRLLAPRAAVLTVSALVLTAALGEAAPPGGRVLPRYAGAAFRFDIGRTAPSYYGYNLDDTSAGYYGGARYREYYNYGRGYGIANYPGPWPGPGAPPDYRGTLRDFHFDSPPVLAAPASPPQASAAHLMVEVPADAEVWMEGVKTRQSGSSRWFVTPPLATGQEYGYEIRARWHVEGRVVEQKQDVVIHARDRINVKFPLAQTEELPEPKRFPLQDEQ